jgi:hypothetical protein
MAVCIIMVLPSIYFKEGFFVRKTTKRKATTRKKTAARKPVRKATARKKPAARKTARKVMRKTTRKAAPKRSTKKVTKKKATKRAGGAKLWTPMEVKMLKQAYKNTSTTEIAKKLKRSLSSVRSKAVALSLKKAAPKRKAAARKKIRRR